jgi:hypothetical protein
MQHGSAPVRHRRLPGRGKTQAIACSPVFMPAALAVIDTLLLRFKFPNRVALGFATMQREYSLYLSLVQGAPIGLQAAARRKGSPSAPSNSPRIHPAGASQSGRPCRACCNFADFHPGALPSHRAAATFEARLDDVGPTLPPAAARPAGALRFAGAPRPGLLPPRKQKAQITPGLSLSLDEKRGVTSPRSQETRRMGRARL